MDRKEAEELLQALISASQVCLDFLNIPYTPGRRTRPWRTSAGPEGIAFHYTGGMSGVKSLRWFNDPAWKNDSSSAHVLIFDRLVPELELWSKQAVSAVFTVPTMIIADMAQGTWCTNWANNRCLGIENRNAGTAPFSQAILQKSPVNIGGKWWEPYTRDQMRANVLLGRIFRAIQADTFKPEWIVGHSQIWATKQDPGPLFPLYLVRKAIWSDEPVELLPWIRRIPRAEGSSDLTEAEENFDSGYRGDPGETEASWDALHGPGVLPPAEIKDMTVWLCDVLYRLGWPTMPEILPDDELRNFVAYYQRSTLAYKEKHPDRVLAVDGIAGPKTRESLKQRLRDLGAI